MELYTPKTTRMTPIFLNAQFNRNMRNHRAHASGGTSLVAVVYVCRNAGVVSARLFLLGGVSGTRGVQLAARIAKFWPETAFLWLRSRANKKPHKKAHSLPRRGGDERCVPSENATEEAHANFLCRLWDFERPRPQIPIPRHKTQEGLCCDVLLCLQGARPAAGRGARARHAARWLLLTPTNENGDVQI